VYGDNGTGKSTLYNAFTWLMYGKAANGEKGYTPKTSGSHNLSHTVEMTAETDDGAARVFKKDYHEVYKTQKGSAQEVFSGHTSDYYIDGVPVKEAEFKGAMASIYRDEELAKMLTMYDYFLDTMKPADRRGILLKVCGDVDDGEVYASNAELAELPELLEKPGGSGALYTVDEYMKIAAKRKSDIDRELESIPAMVNEAQRAKPDLAGRETDTAALDSLIDGYNRRIRELEAEAAAGVDTEAVALSVELSGLETKRAQGAAEYAKRCAEERREALARVDSLKRRRDDAEYAASRTERDIQAAREDISRMESQRGSLLEEWQRENARQWQGGTVCPTCGQALPEEQVNAARESFNTAKSKRLEEISRRGQSECSIDAIDKRKAGLAALSERLAAQEAEIAALESDVRSAEESVPVHQPYDSTRECIEIDRGIASLRERIQAAGADAPQTDTGAGEAETLRGRIQECVSLKTEIGVAARQDARIAELEAREKELGAQYGMVKKGIHLCELFTRTKAAMLDDRINSKFRTLRFRLFVEQVNGGISDDCEALIPCNGVMVPFKSANNAARINAGLEVIGTLAAHYGVELPVFIDNAESVTRFDGAGGMQLIRLVVSEADKAMRFEGGL
jgi:hypothetical protein